MGIMGNKPIHGYPLICPESTPKSAVRYLKISLYCLLQICNSFLTTTPDSLTTNSAKHWMENRLQRKQVFRVPNSDSSIKRVRITNCIVLQSSTQQQSAIVVLHSYQLPPLNGKHALHQNWIGIGPPSDCSLSVNIKIHVFL
ncbi:hypothetical protein MKW98_017300 [Papaver atlanticum]|uniref:Uncharacterized protein n=1 Tax=Papaver atlanticum TaxID=357466 RepID=A0AAD4SSD9_9MAGN|nr:hypothetical protein MKW98_017300 [Papaver atlanticum]